MSEDWNTYRTRFLVRARQLTEPLAFTDPLGREHHGRPGDYLVQSSEGLLRVAPREIFEDVYVVMESETARRTKVCIPRSDDRTHPYSPDSRQHAYLTAFVEKKSADRNSPS